MTKSSIRYLRKNDPIEEAKLDMLMNHKFCPSYVTREDRIGTKLIGYACYDEESGEIIDAYVHPKYRGIGKFMQMLKALQQTIPYLTIEVPASSHPRFVEEFGEAITTAFYVDNDAMRLVIKGE